MLWQLESGQNSASVLFNVSFKCYDEVQKIVMSLITKYKSDCFEISVFIIQSLHFGISDTLTFLINKALKAPTFPDCLKRAVVVTIFKSGNVSEAYNYRPISLLHAISKVFEKIIYIRVTSFLKQPNQLHNHQFGFRSKLGTIEAFISVVDSILNQLQIEQTSNFDTCNLSGLKKAFDTVDHSFLVKKIVENGIPWTYQYLTKKLYTKQRTTNTLRRY